MEQNKRDYWQSVRGLLILCVVLIHCKNGAALQFEKTQTSMVNFHFWIVERNLINFPVAIFFFLSGYFMNIVKIQENTYSWMCSRLKKLSVPYIVWTVIYTALSNINNESSLVKTLLKNIISGGAAAPMYFILVLIQITILTPFMVRFQSKKVFTAFLCITAIYLLVMYGSLYVAHKSLPMYQKLFPAWIFFYLIGYMERKNNWTARIKKEAVWLIVSVLGSIAETYLLIFVGVPINAAVSQIRLFPFCMDIILICIFCKNQNTGKCNRFLKLLGDYSYGIFYVHMLFVWAFGNFIDELRLSAPLIIIQVAEMIFTIGLTIVFCIFARKSLGKEKAVTWLGI